MRSPQRLIVHVCILASLVPLAACASSGARARRDRPADDRDRAERDRDDAWERAERDRVERERAERDRIERNTPSRENDGSAYPAGWDRRSDAPRARVWIEGGASTYRPGDRVRALFRVDESAYVTIVRVDTDGRMRVLFPRSPRESAWVRGDYSYRVPGTRGASFVVDDPTGLGYVFAITSYERFDYSSVSYGREWDYEAIGYRVSGDPFIAVRRFADRIAYDDRTGYATAYDEYYVGRHVEYPRYACYDCHAAGTYPVHDPYGHACPRVRVVVYSDPYYYPYRYYPGTRVVYAPRPKYEFKQGGAAAPTRGGAGGTYASGGTAVEHRRREEDVDLRRPGSPTADPNIQPRPSGNPGATRPGDDVQAPDRGGRRRVDDVSDAPAPPTRDGLGTPRRGAGDEQRDGPRPEQRSDDGREQQQQQQQQPRREPPGGGESRRDDGASSRGEGGRGRRDVPRFDPPREAGSDAGSPRSETRRDSPRSEPQSERRGEPRQEPRSEPRAEPRSEPREERRSEPRSEPKSDSRGSTSTRRRPE